MFYLLPHSHNDIGYTQLQPEVEKKQWNNTMTAAGPLPEDRELPAGRAV